MRVVQDRQVSEILGYLRQAMRGDPELIDALGCHPDEVIRGVLEDEPMYRDEAGELKAYAMELPCLCLHATGSNPSARAARNSSLVNLELCYVLQTPTGDLDPRTGRPLTGTAKLRRWLRTLSWRLEYWIRQHRLPPEKPLGQGEYDLLTAGGIHSLTTRATEFYPAGGKLSGFKVGIEMVQSTAPYEKPAPGIVSIIEWTAAVDLPSGDLDVDGKVTLT